MRHRRLRRRLGVKTKHRRALLRNLLRNLVFYKQIKTTVAKAREVSAFSDRMITIAKRTDLHSRRVLISKLGSPDVAKLLISEIAPHFKDRNGGYTRVIRLGTRPGDGAELAIVEFTATIELPKKDKKPKKSKKPKKEGPAPDKKQFEKKKEVPAEKPEAGKAPDEEKEKKGEKESEKKGGFLSTLRKFLKGDDH